jgi:hypothetical protein
MTIYKSFIKTIEKRDILKINIKILIKLPRSLNLFLKVRNT